MSPLPISDTANLLAQPDATVAVNNMLKAITASLLMEQVLAPNYDFKPAGGSGEPGALEVKGLAELSTDRVKQIVHSDLNEVKAAILQHEAFAKAAASDLDPETINKVLVPKIIRERYPDLSTAEVEEVRQRVVLDAVVNASDQAEVGDKRMLRIASQFIAVEELSINLVDKVNPFQQAFEVMSKQVTPAVMRLIQETITASRLKVTQEEAKLALPRIKAFVAMHKRPPSSTAKAPEEKRLGEVLVWLKAQKRKAEQQGLLAEGAAEGGEQ